MPAEANLVYARSDGPSLNFSGPMIHSPVLPLTATFYPYGFPFEVSTNFESVLSHFHELWGNFVQRHNTEPVRCDVQVVESGPAHCPPPPEYRLMLPLLTCIADVNNYSILDLESGRATITVSRSVLRHSAYTQYFLLGTSLSCLATRLATPVHAGCVSLRGKGVLLCGDSGAGKSSLSYACARAGWTYVSDDGSYLVGAGEDRIVAGNCYRIRFRPSAASLFPELKGLESTLSMNGKPSIERPLPAVHFARAQEAKVDFVVFLNRWRVSAPQLLPYRIDLARQAMRQVLYGSPESLAAQYAAVEKLLTAPVFELRYSSLDWAVNRLQRLIEEER